MALKNNKKKAKTLAILGTGSDVGKSVIATALCRFFVNKKIKVAPFKSQNMSNNSGVTPEGLEMGRAQIVQAEAAKLPPCVDMNPVLLKPTDDIGSQVVFMGKVMKHFTAQEYYKHKIKMLKAACASLNRLRENYEIVVIEGAGSCAEVNLMKNDIVNMKMAKYADAKIILVADIHRGGVFAQIVGTLKCLSPSMRKMIAGFIINRFRGDIKLFDDGVKWIEKQTKKPVFGVLPYFTDFQIEAEDSVVIESPKKLKDSKIVQPAIAIIRIPHISNFTDFDPLLKIKTLNVYFLEKAQDINKFSAVILPGSKATRSDLKWLYKTGWADKIIKYSKRGGNVLGICGGYQMMGVNIKDTEGIEGTPGTSKGLSLLPVETHLTFPKTTVRTLFSLEGSCGAGYEIHMGKSHRKKGKPLFEVYKRNEDIVKDEDGCISEDGNSWGTYIHGLFDYPDITKRWLKQIGINRVVTTNFCGLAARDKDYDKLAEHFEKHIDMEKIMELII